MGWLSFIWASKARHEVRYLEERVRVMEYRVLKLETEVIPLMVKKG